MEERAQGKPERFSRARRNRATDEGSIRQRRISVPLSEVEHARLHRMAAERHMAVAAFVAEAALAADSVETTEERKQLIVQLYKTHTLLARISNNVNQIARATNATGEAQEDTQATLAGLRRTAERLDSLCDELSLS